MDECLLGGLAAGDVLDAYELCRASPAVHDHVRRLVAVGRPPLLL